jgi:hypothetical protein
MVLPDNISKALTKAIQVLDVGGVLETGQRRLRCERLTVDRVTADQHLADGVVAKPAGVVGIGIAARDRQNTLAKQLVQIVHALPGLPIIAAALGQPLGQPEPLVSGSQEDSAAIRAGVGLVERGDERLVEEIGEQNRLSRGRVRHAKASVVVEAALASAFYREEAFVLSESVNFQG